MKKVSVIIINYNTAEMTERTIQALCTAEPELDMEVILIDNASKESLPVERFKEITDQIIINNKNLGFAKAVNQGIKAGNGRFVLLLNSDMIIESGTVSRLLEISDGRQDAGIAGPQLLTKNGGTQPSCGSFPTVWGEILRFSMMGKIFRGKTLIFKNRFTDSLFQNITEVDWVSGGLMLIKREVLEKIGSLDEDFFFGVEDFDLCYRAKSAGWKVLYAPEAKALHYHGLSSGGRRSTWSLRQEATGMDKFLSKNFPEKKILRVFDKVLYGSKAVLLDLAFKKNK